MIFNFKTDIASGFFNLVPARKISEWVSKYSMTQNYSEAFENFEYRLHKSRGDSPPDISALTSLLAESVQRFEKLDPWLLLSSGKDSVALALAFHDCGIKLNCISLVSDVEEEAWIKSLCNKLGHQVVFVRVDEIKSWLLSNNIDLAPANGICYDQAIIFFLVAFNILGLPKGVTLVDGMGNDLYFGHIPSRNQLKAQMIGAPLRLIPWISSVFGFYVREPVQAHGLATASSFIFAKNGKQHFDTANINDVLKNRIFSIRDTIDFRAFFRGSLIDEHCYAEKTRVMARQFGYSVSFPWAEHQPLSDYIFNLPESFRFDQKKLVNKLLLRSMLADRIAYSRPKRGIDLLDNIDIEEISRFQCVMAVPEILKAKLLNSRFLPLQAKKRGLMELSILSSLSDNIGISAVDVLNGLD